MNLRERLQRKGSTSKTPADYYFASWHQKSFQNILTYTQKFGRVYLTLLGNKAHHLLLIIYELWLKGAKYSEEGIGAAEKEALKR